MGSSGRGVLTSLQRWPTGIGAYLFPYQHQAASTSAALNNGNLRLSPIIVPNACELIRVGGEVTIIGDVGSTLLMGLYRDTGNMAPGALLASLGTIAGDSATVQEVVLGAPLVLAPGLYWLGAAVQGVTVTQPTVRTITGSSPLVRSTVIPTAGENKVGLNQTGVTGALPDPYSATPTPAGSAARLFFKLT